MSDSHKHNHFHIQSNSGLNRALIIGIILNIAYSLTEFLFGLVYDSMALIADAGHNFSDVLGLFLAWIASNLAQTAVTSNRTYGLRKSTILAALLNSLIIYVAIGAITIESIRKIIEPYSIEGTPMIVVAGIGVVINMLTAFLFLRNKDLDLNAKGAYLHMIADAAVSIGVVVTGVLINITNWPLLDPLVSLLIVIVISVGTWNLLRDSFFLAVDAVPKGIEIDKVREYLLSIRGVADVHDLHIWAMSTTENALTVHLVMPNSKYEGNFIKGICNHLEENFNIHHSTIQVESESNNFTCEEKNV